MSQQDSASDRVKLANRLRQEGRLVEARDEAAKAVAAAPESAGAWFSLGAALAAQGELEQGIAAYRKALELDPDYAEAWSNLGAVLGEQGDRAEEIAAYGRALAANPGLAPVWSNLGNALRETGALAEAVAACRRAVERDPAFAPAWNNLGNALHEGGEHEEAVRACETALKLAPGLTEAWSTLGGALLSLRRYDEAVSAQRRALHDRPGAAQLHFNLGVTLRHSGQTAEAIACFRRALAIDPGHVAAHYDLGYALLSAGELREGWQEYEWRWRRPGTPPPRYAFAPWSGDATRAGRLLLWGEQGIGDQIIYASMVADLVNSPLEITLEVDARLVSLYRRSLPGVTVMAQQHPPGADPAAYDSQAPLPGLGRWLRPSFASFPQRKGWLEPDAARARACRDRLLGNARGAQCIVGISWKSANQELGPFKSSALADWLDILRVPGAHFVDLQYGDTTDERAGIERGDARIEHLPELDLYHDLDGLAALCAACDLVITVSNVNAHVAGALGRPVWLVLPKANGRLWYWLAGRTDSPWYPSMRIHTQQTLGSWRGVLDEVAGELADWVQER